MRKEIISIKFVGWNWTPKQKNLEFNSEKEAQEYVEKWNKSHPMTQMEELK